jgi:hypothetical protein
MSAREGRPSISRWTAVIVLNDGEYLRREGSTLTVGMGSQLIREHEYRVNA